MRLAIKGNATALNLVWERLDGKVVPTPEVETPQEVRITVVYGEDETVPPTHRLPVDATDGSQRKEEN
jgi:hypothetical protein